LRETSIYVLGTTALSKVIDKQAPVVESTGAKGKKFEGQLGPLFRSSRVWISSQENEYLSHFRNEWLSYPDGAHDDTLDATYYMVYAAMMQGALAVNPEIDEEMAPWYDRKARQSRVRRNPWAGSLANG
jgi:hypothetical protein